jgi:glycerate-2-kinase
MRYDRPGTRRTLLDLLGKPFLTDMFCAAVAAAEPGALVQKALRPSASGLSLTAGGVSSGLGLDDLRKIYFVGGGKGAHAMGEAVMQVLGERVAVLSAGTDGVDGPTDAARAYVRGDTCARARAAGLSPGGHLSENDSYPFFQSLSDLVITGPTGTNVSDIALGAIVGKRQI